MASCSEKEPRHISRIVGYILEVGAEALATGFACDAFSPSSIVFQRCPVYFRHHDGGNRCHWTYLRIPSALEGLVAATGGRADSLATVFFGIAAIPSGIAVHGKSDVVSLDAVGGISGILRLVAQARHPDDITAMVPYLVYNGLKVNLCIGKASIGGATIGAVGPFDVDRFIGKFEHDVRIVLHFGVLRNDVPHVKQKLLIAIAHLYSLIRSFVGAYPGRAHHHIHSLRYKILRHRHKQFVEILAETGLGKAFVSFVSHKRL